MHSTNEKKPTKSQGEFTSEYETGIFMWVINYFNLAWSCKEWGSSYYIDINNIDKIIACIHLDKAELNTFLKDRALFAL